ncbi:hypothetical protein D6C84_05803 [Aureobasidium pullulans]|uniref:Uncharacterized protein n=1 Tax=Aureobasidium pullulans TaxID=5580 RepID=A0A4S9XRC1_AURPU|nr:hypothetical protein D6C84_05803 [Aureobasidium pullulans]
MLHRPPCPINKPSTSSNSPNNEPSHPLIDPGGPYYLSRHFHNTAKSFNLSCTSHHPGPPLHTSQAKTKLAKNSAGLRLSVRVDFGGHGMAQDPLSTVEHGRAPVPRRYLSLSPGACTCEEFFWPLPAHRRIWERPFLDGTSAHCQACTITNNVSRPLLVNRVIDRRSWYTARSIRKLSNIRKATIAQ